MKVLYKVTVLRELTKEGWKLQEGKPGHRSWTAHPSGPEALSSCADSLHALYTQRVDGHTEHKGCKMCDKLHIVSEIIAPAQVQLHMYAFLKCGSVICHARKVIFMESDSTLYKNNKYDSIHLSKYKFMVTQ